MAVDLKNNGLNVMNASSKQELFNKHNFLSLWKFEKQFAL